MQMENCAKCGRLFSRMSNPICDDCMKAEEELFQTVKKFIDENENSTMEEITKATGVSGRKLLKYLKEGRLEISKGMGNQLRCESCNKPIRSGRYCDTCVININQTVQEIFEKPNKPSAVMHTRTDKK